MISIDEVCIISIDKSEDVWDIEGEIIFDDDIACPFEASYVAQDDEFEQITAEMDLDEFDRDELLDKIKFAVFNYEE
ncbi:hypothetical protein SDC9_93962 [bioreactor metagenome]|uniref:Uncharacterized protein n=1 Tax=bioreactor metagenome TaxID=1076179 RepID=A0A645AC36_9ZZZZ|nr:hypothetical protein [Candidatus Metalachnospira sp.]